MTAHTPPTARCSRAAGRAGAQLAQLVVDLDPQGLEDPAGRMPLPAHRGRDRGRHDVGQLTGRREWTGPHDGPSDAPRETALSVLTEQRGERVLREAVHQVRRRHPGGRVHPHVEWPVGAEREAPLGTVELGRADAEVEQDARQGPRPAEEMTSSNAENGDRIKRDPVPERRPTGGCAASSATGSRSKPDHAEVWVRLEQRRGVPASADGGVDEHRRAGTDA